MLFRRPSSFRALLAITAAVLLGVPAAASAATYYVSTSGLDTNAGTSSSAPWKTLTKATNATLLPGDSVLLKAGDTFSAQALQIDESGTALAPISVTRYGTSTDPDPKVTGLKSGYCFLLKGSYISLTHTSSDGCGYTSIGAYGGIGVWGSNNVVSDNYVTHENSGIAVKEGSNTGTYEHNTLVDNNVYDSQATSGAYGFNVHGDYNTFSYNTVQGSAAVTAPGSPARTNAGVVDGGAFEIYNGDYNTIRYNRSIDSNNFSESGHDSTQTSTTNNTFQYNVITSTCTGDLCSESVALTVRGSTSQYGPNLSTVFEHNTVLLTGANAGAIKCTGSCGTSVLNLSGNIIKSAGTAILVTGSAFTEGYNVINGTVSGMTLASSDSTSSPVFVSESTLDLHLQSTSPAIDRAVNAPLGVDFDGNGVPVDGDCDTTSTSDSGAYEYQTSC